MELWDAYDADFNKLEGITLVRGEEDELVTYRIQKFVEDLQRLKN